MMALAAMISPAAAAAQSRQIDLRQPQVVVDAVKEAGYKAVLKKGDDGDPFIESAANGSSFTIYFYGCDKGKDCASLQFYAWYKKAPYYSIDLANRWNTSKRFIRAAIDKDGDLATTLDITTLGGTYESFADSLDWWTVMTADLFEFLNEEEKKAAPAAK